MSKESKIWDAETDKKVKALAQLLNAQMVSLNQALTEFTKTAQSEGYEVAIIPETGLIEVSWIEPEIVTPEKSNLKIT